MRSLGFNIEECKPKYSIPYAQRKYGTPFLNKYVSEMIQRLQSHNFKFKEDGNKPFEELMIKYPNTKNALLWWTNRNISSLSLWAATGSNSFLAKSLAMSLDHFLFRSQLKRHNPSLRHVDDNQELGLFPGWIA